MPGDIRVHLARQDRRQRRVAQGGVVAGTGLQTAGDKGGKKLVHFRRFEAAEGLEGLYLAVLFPIAKAEAAPGRCLVIEAVAETGPVLLENRRDLSGDKVPRAKPSGRLRRMRTVPVAPIKARMTKIIAGSAPCSSSAVCNAMVFSRFPIASSAGSTDSMTCWSRDAALLLGRRPRVNAAAESLPASRFGDAFAGARGFLLGPASSESISASAEAFCRFRILADKMFHFICESRASQPLLN